MDIAPPEGNVGLPRGLADTAGVVGFVSGAEGVERLDLRTGQRVWGTELARYPVALWHGQLLAFRPVAERATVLQLVTLDIEHPESLLLSSGPIPVPGWMSPSRTQVSIDVSIHGEELTVAWASERAYNGGAPPPRDVESAAARSAAGAARVSLTTGAVSLDSSDRSVRRPSPELVDLRDGEWYSKRWRAGADTVRLVLTELEGKQRLSLEYGQDATTSGSETGEHAFGRLVAPGEHGHNSPLLGRAPGAAGDRLALAEGAALVGVVSLDQAHVVVRDEARAGGELDAFVFSIPRRAQVAAITWEPGAEDVVVFSDRMVYLVRHVERAATSQSMGIALAVLKARGLGNNQILWEHSLDRVQTGPRRVRP